MRVFWDPVISEALVNSQPVPDEKSEIRAFYIFSVHKDSHRCRVEVISVISVGYMHLGSMDVRCGVSLSCQKGKGSHEQTVLLGESLRPAPGRMRYPDDKNIFGHILQSQPLSQVTIRCFRSRRIEEPHWIYSLSLAESDITVHKCGQPQLQCLLSRLLQPLDWPEDKELVTV